MRAGKERERKRERDRKRETERERDTHRERDRERMNITKSNSLCDFLRMTNKQGGGGGAEGMLVSTREREKDERAFLKHIEPVSVK